MAGSSRFVQGEANTHGVVRLNEGVVDGDDVDVIVLDAGGKTRLAWESFRTQQNRHARTRF